MNIVYDRGKLDAGDMLKYLLLNGEAESAIRNCIVRREALREAETLGIGVSDEALQSFADEYRKVRNLHYSQDMLRFLESKGLSVDDFERYCEESLALELIRERLADGDAVGMYFVNNRSRFDRARLSIITVEDENLAQELAMRISEDGEDFHALAREYSADEYRYAGGYIGLVRRGSFPAEMDARIFNATAGDVLGPFPDGSRHHLFLVEEVVRAEMNDATAAEVKERIFAEWAARFFQRGVQVTS